MNEPENRTVAEFLPQEIKAMQILNAAFMLGLFGFVLVVLCLFLGSSTPESGLEKLRDPDGSIEHLRLLSIASVPLVISAWAAGLVLYRLRTSRKALLSDSSSFDIRGAFILRLACIEGSGLFGCVICLLGVTDHTIDDHPLLWLNLLSPAVALGFMAVTFPTRKSLQKILAGIQPGPDGLWTDRASP